MIAALLGNIHRDEKRRPTPFTPEDFFPPMDSLRTATRQSAEQQIQMAEMINAAFGGKGRRRKRGG